MEHFLEKEKKGMVMRRSSLTSIPFNPRVKGGGGGKEGTCLVFGKEKSECKATLSDKFGGRKRKEGKGSVRTSGGGVLTHARKEKKKGERGRTGCVTL